MQEYPVPVVRLIIKNAQGKVLILKRSNSEYAADQWCLPGGKVDYNETIEQSIAKELREETSLECTSAKFLFLQDSIPAIQGKMHCINLYFECEIAGDVLINDESSDFAWIGPSDLENYQIVFRHDIGLIRFWQENKNQISK